MATDNNIASIVPPGKRDAALASQCASFVRLEVELAVDDIARCNHKLDTWTLAEMKQRQVELDQLVETLCRSRARTLNGIRARVRTLLPLRCCVICEQC